MNLLKKRIASALAAGAMVLNLATPALATTLQISGNGTESTSEVNLAVEQTTQVYQNNNADVTNDVQADATTGGNTADDNTGGDVNVDTGNAQVLVDVANSLNSNTAEVDCCGLGDIDVLVEGNGSESENAVNLAVSNGTTLVQDNHADVTNKVDANATTGDNQANDNTGGSVSIGETGNATVGVSLATSANANSARLGGHGEGEGALSARILGNGTESVNTINLAIEKDLGIFQSNVADIFNGVWADADSGNNEASDNTGGEVSIDTGNALTGVEIDNMVNFNWADVDCGCLFDILAKIDENGSDTENTINAALSDNLLVAQSNCGDEQSGVEALVELPRSEDCELDNKVDADSTSGDNNAEDNTGDVDSESDPSIDSGDASTGVDIENTGNANVFGDGFELPELDFDFDFGLNWAFMMAWLSGSSS